MNIIVLCVDLNVIKLIRIVLYRSKSYLNKYNKWYFIMVIYGYDIISICINYVMFLLFFYSMNVILFRKFILK